MSVTGTEQALNVYDKNEQMLGLWLYTLFPLLLYKLEQFVKQISRNKV
jgi:hypothetical protein